MKVQDIAIDKVIPYAGNPRKNKDAIANVAASLREFGFRQPIVVDSEMVVVVGHTRLAAARELGLAKVPVHIATDMTPDQARAYRLADNRTGEDAEWDIDLLGIELTGLMDTGFDIDLTGFDPGEVKELLGNIAGTDYPDLKDGDRDPYQEITFILHDTQLEALKAALKIAKQDFEGREFPNANGNGNAISLIAEFYQAEKGGRNSE